MTEIDDLDIDYDPDDGYAEFMEREAARLSRYRRPADYGLVVTVGSEGPHHDPYSFRDYQVVRPDGTEVRYRAGLGEELWLDGELISHCEDDTEERFELLAGFPVDVLDHWDEQDHDFPCMACGAERGCRGNCQE